MTLTNEDTQLLAGAGALVKRTTAQLYRIRKENTRLKHALVAAQADAALYKARAEAWEARARAAEAANRSFTSPASGGEEKPMFDYLKDLSDEALIDELIPARDQIAEAGPAGYLVAVVSEIWGRGLGHVLTEEDKAYL